MFVREFLVYPNTISGNAWIHPKILSLWIVISLFGSLVCVLPDYMKVFFGSSHKNPIENPKMLPRHKGHMYLLAFTNSP